MPNRLQQTAARRDAPMIANPSGRKLSPSNKNSDNSRSALQRRNVWLCGYTGTKENVNAWLEEERNAGATDAVNAPHSTADGDDAEEEEAIYD